MIGLDTNVLVRYATQDDPAQVVLAEDVMRSLTPESPGFVSSVTLAEAVWVLRSAFHIDPDGIAQFVRHLLASVELVVEHSEAARAALEETDGSALFTDALLAQIAIGVGCEVTVTFDRRAAQLRGMRLLE